MNTALKQIQREFGCLSKDNTSVPHKTDLVILGSVLILWSFNSGSAGSGMEIPFKALRHNWIPEEEKVSS